MLLVLGIRTFKAESELIGMVRTRLDLGFGETVEFITPSYDRAVTIRSACHDLGYATEKFVRVVDSKENIVTSYVIIARKRE